MKKRFLLTVGAAALSMLALCGCGATTEKIVDKMFAEKAESFHSDIDMDVDVEAAMAGMSVNLGASGSVGMDYDAADEDEIRNYMDVNVKVSAMGDSQKIKTEAYAIMGEDEVTTYIKDPDSDEWAVASEETEEPLLDEDARESVMEEFKEVLKTAELQKGTEKMEGETCYVLKLNTTADAFEGVIDVVLENMDEDLVDEMKEAGVDSKSISKYLGYFNLDTTIYASKKSGKCVCITVNMADSDTAGLLKKVSKDFGELADGFGLDLSSVELSFDALEFTAVFSDWGNVEVSVPKDVKKNAVSMDLDLGDIGSDISGGDVEPVVDGPEPTEAPAVPTEAPAANNGGMNDDGSYPLYDYYGNLITNVYPLDGYHLDEDYSDESYIFFSNDSYGSIGVWSSNYLGSNLDEVLAGEYKNDGNYDYYLLWEDETNLRMVVDLGISDDKASKVYAYIDGEYDVEQGDFTYASYYLCYSYDYSGNDWVQVSLNYEDAKNWDVVDYIDAYNEMFR